MAGVKDGKEKKGRDDGGGSTTAQIKRLASEIAALRADFETMRRQNAGDADGASGTDDGADGTSGGRRRRKSDGKNNSHDSSNDAASLNKILTGDNDAAISIGHAYRFQNTETGDVTESSRANVLSGLERILETPDSQVARFGLAFSSAPKIALIRTLIREGTRSATDLGEQAGLTTGSLYHHLRELTHSGVIESVGRGRFGLTGIGRETALILFAQAGRREETADN